MLRDGEKGAILQRDRETYAIAPHLPCGVVTSDALRKLADVADKYKCVAIKVTSAARIALVGLREEDIDAVWADLGMSAGAAVGLCVRSIKACPGATLCKLGKQDALGIGMKLDEKFHGMELPGKLKIGVSGCTNQCAETPVKDVGLVGKRDGWTVTVGGCAGARPRLADAVADGLSDDEALALVDKIVTWYKTNGPRGKRIGRLIDEVGLDTLRQAVLA